MTKDQALQIIAQLAAQFRATPQEHEVIKSAIQFLATLDAPPSRADSV